MRAIFECSSLASVRKNNFEISKEECEIAFFENFENY